MSLHPIITNDIFISNISAILELKNDNLKLGINSTTDIKAIRSMHKQRFFWGKPKLESILHSLQEV
jgi:hypothetical protein